MGKEINHHELVKRLKHYLVADEYNLLNMSTDFKFWSLMAIRHWIKKNKIPRKHLENVQKYLDQKG